MKSGSKKKLILALAASVSLSASGAGPALPDAGMETDPTKAGWELTIYGAQPTAEIDSSSAHEGGHAWKIAADQPSDAALGLEVTVEPRRWYQFSGWVRTKGLDPRDASVFGTVQVQRSQGRGVLGSGESHRGDTDWTRVSAFFQAPSDGRARLVLFFAGFGRGTGAAWFDDLHLDEVQPGQTSLKITKQPLVNAKISPMQYGQFVEYLCNLVPSLWAERLYDGGFEGLTPYKVAFIKETDFKEKPWYPSGQVDRAVNTLDRESKVGGDVSKKIEVADGAPCTVGFSQDGIYVERGKACDFRIWLRARGIHGSVRVKLHRESNVYASTEFSPSENWAPFAARLAPAGTDANTTLSIEFSGPGTLWADNASLMPVDNIGGWRPDVVEAVRALKPGIIRFGGSALDDPNLGEFEWKDTIGDVDHRKPFRAWGGLQPTGPGIEEFVQFCQTVGAEPLICLRFSRRTPRDAAEEVEYFNGSTSTPMGAWRAKNGHAASYNIRYWQIGNERESKEYEDSLPEFCEAVRKVDPNAKLMSSFPTPAVLKKAGAWLDYVCPHHYTEDLAWMERNLEEVDSLARANAPGRNIKIGVTEWNTTAGDWGPRRQMLLTLENALACSRYHNLMHRRSDVVEIANRSNLANSFCSGIIQMDNHRLYKAPTYYAQQLYATLAGDQALKTESTLPANVGLDISATLSTDGRMVTLFAINDGLDDAVRTLDFSEFGKKGQRIHVWTLSDQQKAGEPDAVNDFAEPNRVIPVTSEVREKSPQFDYKFPALSLTVLRWNAE